MKMNIKQTVGYLLFSLWVAGGLAACEGNEIFEKEQYKKVIYVLSDTDLTFGSSHTLNTPVSTGYITIYAGGTQPIDHDISVTLEKDTTLLEKYNLSNFDLDRAKYAKLLDPSRYTIKNYTVLLKAGAEDPYTKLPIEVRTEGLSPDSTYLIPLRIVDDPGIEINKEKNQVLYRVYIENDFTSQKRPTVLFMRGTQIGERDTGKPRQMSANKSLYPLTKRTVRVNAGLENSANRADENQINRAGLIMEIQEEKALTIHGEEYNPIILRPYKEAFIQVEQTSATNDEDQVLSIKESNRYITEEGTTRFYLSYKYRTLKIAATGDEPAIWNNWIFVYENMKVSEI